jgi:hypothetical protein
LLQVPPKNSIEQVPLGASSASMYPGYSPADHVYGEAAQEYGTQHAELKRSGMEPKLDSKGPQYTVGQRQEAERVAQQAEEVQRSSSSSANRKSGGNHGTHGEPMEGVEQSTDQSQYFIIDPKPTPLNEMGETHKHRNKANDKAKRRVYFPDEQSAGTKTQRSKSAKAAQESELQSKPQAVDFSAEVEARLKAKEAKRKLKEAKKRKRNSGSFAAEDSAMDSSTCAAGLVEANSIAEPKRKKSKKDRHDQVSSTDAVGVTREPPVENEAKEKKQKKKRKDGRNNTDEQGRTPPNEEEKPKKRRKVDGASSR